MPVERLTIKLPDGFDPQRHLRALAQKIVEANGEGWEIESIDADGRVAYATRSVAVIEMDQATQDTIELRLPRGTKPADGERVASKLEDQHPGYYMTRFEPFLGKAVLERMTDDLARCRGAVASGLGVKPWEVTASATADGGYLVKLPPKYVPSRHDDKLIEVATAVVGADGWRTVIDPTRLVARFIPGDPPTFPETIPYPFSELHDSRFDITGDWSKIAIGESLGGKRFHLDFVESPHALVSGTTGAGKGVTLFSLIGGALAKGWQLVIVDAIKGGVDFADFRTFCRPAGWAEDLPSASCVLTMTYNEGRNRLARIKAAGVKKWTDLPSSEGIRPVLIVVDELTSLIQGEDVAKGIPKDSPVALEIAGRNMLKATILNTLGKIAREQRFTGLHLVVATQVASTVTGVPTELRQNLGSKILLGPKPTAGHRKLALDNPGLVPEVPPNVAETPKVNRGVGVYEVAGAAPGVLKTFYTETSRMASRLGELGVRKTADPAPTPAEIARWTPSLEDEAPRRSGRASPAEWELDPDTGERLTGYARANAARHALGGI